jgi:predicted RecB family nuclease
VVAARLSTLRGVGTANAQLLWQVGVESVADLAASDPSTLGERLRGLAQRPRVATPQKVRVWVRAARRATRDAGSASGGR